MSNFRTINVELENLSGLKTLAEVYQEIAAIYIQKNKEVILESRNFYDGLSQVFSDVTSAYKISEEALLQKKTKKTGKKAMVLLSANAGLYGEIVEKVFNRFEKDAMRKTTNRDLVVVGKYGRALIKSSAVRENYIYFDFPDAKLNFEMLKPIIELLATYEEAAIYYGSFKSLADQVPMVKNVREAVREEKLVPGETAGKTASKYIFEPSLEKLYKFFEAEIFSSIIEQLSYEFTLSKLSSRTLLLDKVIGNIEKEIKKSSLTLQKKKHENMNKKQADSIAGILQATNMAY